ncbi:MAG: GTPase domain-containing protein [Gemmataceae bacterium]|nr:GTPase domain-containing protein [Gemmataceae bacterium]
MNETPTADPTLPGAEPVADADQTQAATGASPPDPGQFLPSLATLLRSLEQALRHWFDQPHPLPLTTFQRAQLLSLLDDLHRQLDLLAAEHPLLLIVLMGGTGVGKSTLLNALAGAPIAPADIQRPTTRDPVVYLHHSIRPERLDPALRLCRLVHHDREELRYKVLVDTPDLDSNVTENRDKLAALLPLADVVLYVGSQEKYHDQLGWELFRQQRQRRAFAFVLNKWDRCLTDEQQGRRPDQDWLRDLQAEGFEHPRLFRTAAALWVRAQQARSGVPPADLPPQEQFLELRRWLEWGLTRREIEAIKARGIEQLLETLVRLLQELTPADLQPLFPRLQTEWQRLLDDAAAQAASALVRCLQTCQADIEHYLHSREQQRFRGFMAAYFRATRWFRHSTARLGQPLRSTLTPLRLSTVAASGTDISDDLPASLPQLFRLDSSVLATSLPAAARFQDLPARLLLAAQQLGWPPAALQTHLDTVVQSQQPTRICQHVIAEALQAVEQELLDAAGPRYLLRRLLTATANYAPELAFLATAALLLWQFIVQQQMPSLFQLSLVLLIPLLVVVTLHLLLHLLLPLDGDILRQRLQHHLHRQLQQHLNDQWLPLLDQAVAQIRDERQRLQSLVEDAQRIRDWITHHATHGEIAQLYGRSA